MVQTTIVCAPCSAILIAPTCFLPFVAIFFVDIEPWKALTGLRYRYDQMWYYSILKKNFNLRPLETLRTSRWCNFGSEMSGLRILKSKRYFQTATLLILLNMWGNWFLSANWKANCLTSFVFNPNMQVTNFLIYLVYYFALKFFRKCRLVTI